MILPLFAQAVILGVIGRDWIYRRRDISHAQGVLKQAESLVDQYKEALTKIHEIDTKRASMMVVFDQRLEAQEMRAAMAKGQPFGQVKAPT